MSLVVPVLLGLLIVASAAVAMSLRNIIHSALCLVFNWFGLAAFYLWAGAEFVAFAQVLIYVGAVSMVVLFAVLLTRHTLEEDRIHETETIRRVASGLLTAVLVAGVLCGAVVATDLPAAAAPAGVTVRAIGERLAGPEAATLVVTGVLLTVALVGAVVLASRDEPDRRQAKR